MDARGLPHFRPDGFWYGTEFAQPPKDGKARNALGGGRWAWSLDLMKSSRHGRVYIWVCAGVVLIGIVSAEIWTPLQIQYHRSLVAFSRNRVPNPPQRLRDYFSVRTIRWMLMGKPTDKRNDELGDEHERALIRLGYFGRRSYLFTNYDRQGFVKAVRAGALKYRLCYFRFGINGVNDSLEVTAHRDDFTRIEKVMQTYGGQR